MEKEDFLSDDLLKDLFRNQSWESPGDGFTGNVMKQILQAPEVAPVKKPFYLILRSSWLYVLLFLVSVLFLMTSDLPFTDYIPGKEYFTKNLLPYLGSLLSGFKPLVSNIKTIMIPLMVILAGSLLVGFDHFLFRKPNIRHQTTH
ncbi:MAG TPA: hypothetical protein VFE66_03160 [Bacteroidales bacterium]|nr:hypothetical protein [Bacteroidales bacterium]